jgi:four helix bundle protein
VAVRSYHDLIVWQKAVAFSVLIYQATKMFLSVEQFGLTNQLRRAAVSIPSNIAEEHAQESDGVLARYLNIAIGSAAELDTQLLIAHKIGYIDAENLSHIQQDLTEIVKLLRGLLRSIRAK